MRSWELPSHSLERMITPNVIIQSLIGYSSLCHHHALADWFVPENMRWQLHTSTYPIGYLIEGMIEPSFMQLFERSIGWYPTGQKYSLELMFAKFATAKIAKDLNPLKV